MQTENATPYREQMLKLLAACKLPYEDLPDEPGNFLVILEDMQVVGCAGIEPYGAYGLLRSVAVDAAFRGHGRAGGLLAAAEQLAAKKGIGELYLLTETAPEYFARKGYAAIDRAFVPDAVKQSGEFAHVCPQSAIVMKKSIMNL